ncbi:MAG: hypothetical protein H6722_04560 [Sandaracinus sp.]|nr:hypothetical protein [Sandaracinus sp.]MCB9620145.1 hypothetical protein [Sandaracinus sp.]
MTRLALGLLLLLGCGDDRPPPDRSASTVGAGPSTTPLQVDPFERPNPDRRARPTDPFVAMPRTEVDRVETPGMAARPAPAASPLEGELRSAAGTPQGCGEMPPVTGELRIPLRATVASNGFVVSASVGGNLPGAVRECMADRIEHHRFAAAEDGPPRSVSAELVLNARVTTMEQREERTERVGWGTGFELQAGQAGIAGGQAQPIAPAAGATTIRQAPGASDIAPPPSTTIAGPSGVSITGPGGRTISD